MKAIFRRGVSALLAMVLLGQSLPAALAGSEEDEVKITADVFPDAGFRQWLQAPENINGFGTDGVLTSDELEKINAIDVSGRRFSS